MSLDEELVEGLKSGKDESFSEIYNRYAEGLLRHLICIVGKKEEAEELLHEAFLLLIKKINFYEPRADLKNSFKAWFYRLATNVAIDELRRKKSRAQQTWEEMPTTEIGDEEELIIRERDSLIGELLGQLPSLQRTVLSLRVYEDLTYLEISAICGKDVNSVKQGLFQARKSLKDLLIQNGELV